MAELIRHFEDPHSRSLLEEVCSNLARQHAENLDQVIAEGIRRMSREDSIKLEDFKGRVYTLRFPDNRLEFHLDGEPFLEIFSVQVVTESIGNQPWDVQVVSKQNYRYLGRAADENTHNKTLNTKAGGTYGSFWHRHGN